MYLLDTNFFSEFMRPNPSGKVVEWLDAQNLAALYISFISQAVILSAQATDKLFPATNTSEAILSSV